MKTIAPRLHSCSICSTNLLVGLGLGVVVPILGLILLGEFIDKQLGTTPWITLLGVVSGIVIGFLMVIRAAQICKHELEDSSMNL